MSKLKSIEFYLSVILVLLTPLIYVTNTNEHMEFPKMFFVYLIGLTMFFLYFASILWEIFRLGKLSKPIRFPGVSILFFLTVYILSTVFSSHLYTSLWGYYTRFNGGLISILIFAGIYFVMINLFESREYKILFKIAVITLLPVSIYGIFQHYTGMERVVSSFGQPNWLAAYIVFLIPVVLYLYLSGRRLWGIFLAFAFTCLWFTYSFSGLLGLVFGIAVFSFMNYNLLKKEYRKLIPVAAVGLLVVMTSLGTFSDKLYDFWLDTKELISSNARVYAQTEVLNSDEHRISDPGFIRAGLWKGTISLITSSPKTFLIGTGPETYPYEFPPFRPASLNYSSEWDFIFNKPHNYYLELWSNTGILGLSSYLYLAYRLLRRNTYAFAAASLGGFFITNIFGWPSVATVLLFWLFIAGSNADLWEDKK